MLAHRRGAHVSHALLLAGIMLVAANMRPVITAVGPVLDQIGADTGLRAGPLGLLAAVPLLAFAAVSPVAHGISERFGAERTVFAGLLLLLVGTLLRPLPGPMANLWCGTFIIGAAIALFNVLLPSLLKRDFPGRMAQLTGAYSAVLGGVASLGAGLSYPLSQVPGGHDGATLGWRFALVAYGVLAIPALVLWRPWLRRARRARPARPARDGAAGEGVATAMRRGDVWRSPVAWQVTIYMGLQSMVFYVLINWLPTVERAHGRSDASSGWDLMAFQLVGVVSSLLAPLILRGRLLRFGPALPGVLVTAAMLGIMFMPGAVVLWVLVAGFGCGASLVVALSLFGLRAHTHQQAAALSGMAQSIGYLFAAAGPPLFGALHGWTGAWFWPLSVVMAASVLQVVTGCFVGRERFAFPDPVPA